jgi:valyl-tRNA synthetase
MSTDPKSLDLSATTPATERGVVVPDKPALEGLEAAWMQRWSDDDT